MDTIQEASLTLATNEAWLMLGNHRNRPAVDVGHGSDSGAGRQLDQPQPGKILESRQSLRLWTAGKRLTQTETNCPRVSLTLRPSWSRKGGEPVHSANNPRELLSFLGESGELQLIHTGRKTVDTRCSSKLSLTH